MQARYPIRWSERKLAVLERIRLAGSAYHHFGQRLAAAQINAALGDFRSATEGVRAALEEAGDFLELNDAAQTDFLITLFVVQELDILAALLCRFSDPLYPIRLEISDDGPGPARVRWEVVPGKESRFVFDAAMFLHDQMDVRIMLFVWAFPLYSAYMRQCGDGDSGCVIVNLFDVGLSPGLAPSDSRPGFFLIPDHMFISSRGYATTREHYHKNNVPWAERKPVALWRGMTTGQVSDPAKGWRSLPRIRLCEIARSATAWQLIDAGIVAVVQIDDPDDVGQIERSGLMRPFIPPTDFNRYRYHIDIDGNTNSWPGLFQKLLTGSPVLKIASPPGYRQWYYDRLKPWVNYVPVAADMSDLLEHIDWLRENDDRAFAIGQAGRALACSLDYEGELAKSFHTIRAALRYFAGRPELELRFGTGEAANAALKDGWDDPEPGRVWGVDSFSRIELPHPLAPGDLDLTLRLEPHLHPKAIEAQAVHIVANGTLLQSFVLKQSEAVLCIIPRPVVDRQDHLTILLLHPDGFAPCLCAPVGNDAIRSLAISGLTLAPSVHRTRVFPDYGEVAEALWLGLDG